MIYNGQGDTDLFNRKESNGYSFNYDNKRSVRWDKGYENFSDYLMGDRKKSKNDVASLLGSMFRTMGVQKEQKFSASRQSDSIQIPVKLLEKSNSKLGVSGKDMDVFYGSALINAAHTLYLGDAEKSDILSQEQKAKTGDLQALIHTLISEERVQKRVAETYGGYNKFVERFKDNVYSDAPEVHVSDKVTREETIRMLTNLIRFPKHLTPELRKKYKPLIDAVKKTFDKHDGIPDNYYGIDPLSRKLAEDVINFIVDEETQPPSPSQAKSEEKPDTPDKQNKSDIRNEENNSSDKGMKESSDEAKPDESEQNNTTDQQDDENVSSQTDGFGCPGGEMQACKTDNEDDFELFIEPIPPPSQDSEINRQRKINELIYDIKENVKVEFKAFAEGDSTTSAEDEKRVQAMEKFFMTEEEHFKLNNQVSITTPLVSESSKAQYKQAVAKLDLTKSAVLRKLFARKSKNEIFAINSMRSGNLDTNKLCEAVQHVPTVYERQGTRKTNHICIVVLVDQSGSMGGEKINKAREAAVFIDETFGKLADIELFIYGHNTHSGCEVYVYREPGKTYNAAVLGNIQSGGANYDNIAIHWVTDRVRKLTQNAGIFIVISDGQPCSSGNGNPVEDTRKAVKRAEKKDLQVIQIAIEAGIPSEKMFSHWVDMTDIKILPQTLVRYLSNRVDKMFKVTTTF